MALVHSLWMKPMLNNSRGVSLKKHLKTTIWCYASSVAFAYKYNRPIVLYADEIGRRLLSYLPYEHIYNLDIPEDTTTDLWAAGKFYALRQMQLGDVHIDGDVFLKSVRVHDAIRSLIESNDLIVQSMEDSWDVLSTWYKASRDIVDQYHIPLAKRCTSEYSYAWNCGVVGINNEQLKQEYLEAYFQVLDYIRNRPDIINTIHGTPDCTMDLLFEQQHLYELSKGYKVGNLLGAGKVAYDNAQQLGYQHILGSSKWDCLRQIKKQLKSVNPEIYEMTKIKEKYVLK